MSNIPGYLPPGLAEGPFYDPTPTPLLPPAASPTGQPQPAGDRSGAHTPPSATFAPSGVPLPDSPAPQGESADARLARYQEGARASALGEYHRVGGRNLETEGNNRGPELVRYQHAGGIEPGEQWCGAFTAYNLGHAEPGMEFTGRTSLASDRKAESYFMYSSYTHPENGVDTTRQTADTAAGSPRRYMTLQGSDGDRYANEHHLTHEAYSDYHQLPLRHGDIVVMNHHVAMVDEYDPQTGHLTIIEGNARRDVNGVDRRTLDLSKESTRHSIRGFGRPSVNDFQPTPEPRQRNH